MCISWIWRNLVCRRKFSPGDGKMTKIQKFANSRWRIDSILKIIFGYNSAPYCPIKMNFGARRHNCTHTKVWWRKCPISKIQRGGRPPFWKSLYLHISAVTSVELKKLNVCSCEVWRSWLKWEPSCCIKQCILESSPDCFKAFVNYTWCNVFLQIWN